MDTPEFFFENPALLELFESITEYLDFDQRVQVLNSRLEVVGDMFTILTEEVHARHQARLEWIVILLIVVGVVLDLLVVGLDSYLQFVKNS